MNDGPWGKTGGEETPWKKLSPKDTQSSARTPWGNDTRPPRKERKPEEEEAAPKPEEAEKEVEEVLVPVEEEQADVEEGWNRRRRNRSVAIQFLYAWELNRPEELSDGLNEFFIERELVRDDYVYAEELIHGAVEKMEIIDKVIREKAENWDFDRIAKIDLTLLRLGIHELLHRPDVPPVVVINEIIDLGKAYSEKKSKRFLNGILDQVLAQLDRPARESSL
ncbi:MAG: transcription antitermination factor NusB [Opitutae bacterium]|nr:transcription antitermination factor NusB [Opitutae bacterium]